MPTIEKVAIRTDAVTFDALIAHPDGVDTPRPAVLLVHDISGAEPDIERNLRIVASAGYLAMAPLLFTAGKSRIGCIVSTMKSLAVRRGPAFTLLEQARSELATHPESTGEVAIVGFCMGGGFALLEADERYVAAAPFYGAVTTHSFASPDMCPVVASFGGKDYFLPRGEQRLRTALDRHGVTSDIKTYNGVGHSFANQLDLPGGDGLVRVLGLSYDAEAATDAWNRIFAFFDARFTKPDPAAPPEPAHDRSESRKEAT